MCTGVVRITQRGGRRGRACTPHAFRHLVATRLDAAGLSAREIADYLRHERVSMTQDVYMARRLAGATAGAALDVLAPRRWVSGGWILLAVPGQRRDQRVCPPAGLEPAT